MTLQKKLKKVIRARSEKTGESYSAARRQVLSARARKAGEAKPPEPETPAIVVPPAVAPEPPPAAPAAVSLTKGAVTDEVARKRTGHGLDHWFAVLDAFGAAEKGHTAAAAHLYEAHGVPGWHAQGITVAYERARGLRELNQGSGGSFQVSVSKTVPVAVAEVVDALRRPERRAAWLAGAAPELIQAVEAAFTGPKPRQVKTRGDDYAWFRFPWDGATVVIYINAKPKGATVAAQSTALAGPGQVEERRAQWRVALAGLRRHLGG